MRNTIYLWSVDGNFPSFMISTAPAVPGLNLEFLVADLNLGSVVHHTPYYNLGLRSKPATPADTPQWGKCAPKLIFWFFLIRMMNSGNIFQA